MQDTVFGLLNLSLSYVEPDVIVNAIKTKSEGSHLLCQWQMDSLLPVGIP